MKRDEKVRIAIKIAKQLVDVKRTEWINWVSYFKTKENLDDALNLAELLSRSPMLRIGPKRGFKRIYEVIEKNKKTLIDIPLDELVEIFGYISWYISIPSGFGMWEENEEAF